MRFSQLPFNADLSRGFIRDWLLPDIRDDLYRCFHKRAFVKVLQDLQSELFATPLLDDYVVSQGGTFLLLYPRASYMGLAAYACVHPKDAQEICALGRNAYYLTIGYPDDIPDCTSETELRLHCNYGDVYRICYFLTRPLERVHDRRCFVIPRGLMRRLTRVV
jgi:hypothetical protein